MVSYMEIGNEILAVRRSKIAAWGQGVVTLCAVFALSLLTGCYTEQKIYYGIEASDGKIVTGKCHRLENIPTAIRFAREELKCCVWTPSVSESRDSISPLILNVNIPLGSHIAFTSYDLSVFEFRSSAESASG